MVEFGMGNTLITFIEKYYEYDGSNKTNERGLIIGGYKSEWLADLVASFLLENSGGLFEQTTTRYGVYRYDGIVILRGKWINEEIKRWLKI